MITVHIDQGRRHKASSEPLRLIKTTVNCCFTVLGSTGNACVIAVSNNSTSCTCPDSHPFCKHVLFLLQASGLSAQHVLTVSSVNLLRLLHAKPPSAKLKQALLDQHTSDLCSAHIYPHCYFCNRKPSGSLSICSKCGFLSHHHCLRLFLLAENDNGTHCPRCGEFSLRLPSHFIGGYRNFFHVLRHQGYSVFCPTATQNNFSSACLPIIPSHSGVGTSDETNACVRSDASVAQRLQGDIHHSFVPEFGLVSEDAVSDTGLVDSTQPPQDI